MHREERGAGLQPSTAAALLMAAACEMRREERATVRAGWAKRQAEARARRTEEARGREEALAKQLEAKARREEAATRREELFGACETEADMAAAVVANRLGVKSGAVLASVGRWVLCKQPFACDSQRAELSATFDGLDARGREQVCAYSRALFERARIDEAQEQNAAGRKKRGGAGRHAANR